MSAGPAGSGIDLETLRRRLAEAPDAARLRPLGLGRVLAGPEALGALPDLVRELVGNGESPLALLVDATPMRRGDADLKCAVRSMLVADREVRVVRVGPPDGRVHADEETLATVLADTAGAKGIVTVGSGTLADIGKTAALELGGLPHLIV